MDGIDSYLDRLASADPTPGGGSAATLAGALGAALVAMVARITAGKRRHEAVRPEALALAAEADALRARFRAAQGLDEAAYGRVVEAAALPKRTWGEKSARAAALQHALLDAAEAPLAASELCAEGVELAARANALGNLDLTSDVECALYLFRAALTACVANVRISHREITNDDVVGAHRERLAAIVSSVTATFEQLLPKAP